MPKQSRQQAEFEKLLEEVRACRVCEAHLPLGPRPTLRAKPSARVLIVGQAPGTKVHKTGIPWNDPSGDRLREWLDVSREEFYDESKIAIIPMGFCYPGRGKSGDNPPRKECAPLWFDRLLAGLPNIRLVILIGQYAQAWHLKERRKATLTETVRAWKEYAPRYFPLPHPSPRNGFWFRRHAWFGEEVIPELRRRFHEALKAR
ncbi:MAG TPA: uracil-DNA glycosylase family protein [Candidatus Sumerlaeota bacterium]|nr:uracil-DNA glycosylase family protein [Candidatus Sumerlaeota bacterium]